MCPKLTTIRRICILHGRPTSITSNDVDADLPEDAAGLQPPEELAKIQNIKALIHVTNCLGDISTAMCVSTLLITKAES